MTAYTAATLFEACMIAIAVVSVALGVAAAIWHWGE